MKRTDAGPSRPSMEEMLGERIIALMLVVEVISVFLLWTLDPLTSQGQDAFALYLAVDFVAFAMMAYLYRILNAEGRISRVFMIAGCLFIAALFFVSFTLSG
jgi:hypothetical protein